MMLNICIREGAKFTEYPGRVFGILGRVSKSVGAREHCSRKREIIIGNIPRQEKKLTRILNFKKIEHQRLTLYDPDP